MEKTDIHSTGNTRVTNTFCVQYAFQKLFVTRGSTHFHNYPTMGQHLVNIIQYLVIIFNSQSTVTHMQDAVSAQKFLKLQYDFPRE